MIYINAYVFIYYKKVLEKYILIYLCNYSSVCNASVAVNPSIL